MDFPGIHGEKGLRRYEICAMYHFYQFHHFLNRYQLFYYSHKMMTRAKPEKSDPLSPSVRHIGKLDQGR